MKKIGIDCRLAGKKHAGIGRYIEELVKRVVSDQTIQWVLFFYEQNQIDVPKQENVKIVIAPIRHYSVAEQVWMPGIFGREHLDLLHVPHYNAPILYVGKMIITIHDLLWHYQSNSTATTLSPFMHGIKYRAYKLVTARAVSSSQKILVPAETVKKQIHDIFPDVNSDKILITYEGIADRYQVLGVRKEPSTSYLKPKTLFYTGSLYPHKNLMLVVRALKELPDYSLEISSARTVFVDQFMKDVARLGLHDRVRHLGRLTDDQLVERYSNSFALVQPSLSEGFGLTGVEAMASGLPVIASDIPVFHEVYKDGFIPFDPKSVDSFIGALKQLELSKRPHMIEKGKSVSALYSWDKMAKTTLDIYQSVISG